MSAREDAINLTNRIVDALDRNGFIRVPDDMWGWNEVVTEVRRVILDAAFGINDIYAPAKRSWQAERRKTRSVAPNKKKGK